MNVVRLSLRMLRRDWRAGELYVLAAAVVVAVASIAAVGLFTNRVDRAVHRQADALLGADAVVAADHPLPPAYLDAARRLGLVTAAAESFHSMVMRGDTSVLADIKAVSPGYPLRGTLRIASGADAPDRPAAGIPPPGTVWLAPRLLHDLGAAVGGRIDVGDSRMTVGAVLTREPDRAGNVLNLAPRLLMNLADVPATGLVVPGSRVTYSLLAAGDEAPVRRFTTAANRLLGPGERLEDVRRGRPEIRDALARAQRFLGLAALVSVLVAGVAVATAARRFIARHLDGCAVMRCLGAVERDIVALYDLQLLWLGLAAGAVGCAVGWGVQALLAGILAGIADVRLPPAAAGPAVVAMITALAALAAFALPPLLHLRRVPPLRVLRGELGALPPQGAAAYAAGVAAIAGLMLWESGDLRLGAYVLLGIGATLAVLTLLIYALTLILRRVQRHGGAAWRLGLGNLTHRPRSTLQQVLSLGLGAMVLLLLVFVRGDLMAGWQAGIPPDAPNHFLINIESRQVAGVSRLLRAHGIGQADFHPMVRGRLSAINGRAVKPDRYPDDRARRLAAREFNLSWSDRLLGDNRVTAGRWWSGGGRGRDEVSVEQGLAQTLGIRLGDRLTFTIAGESYSARVTSLRKVDWDSFRVNFFMLMPPGTLEAFPRTYVTSFFLQPGRFQVLSDIVRAYPNVTVIDVAAVMDEVRSLMGRVSAAMEYVFSFTLAAGLVVLYAAIQSTLDERIHENAVLRILGARRRQLQRGLLTEFAVLGLLAGIVASGAAAAIGYVLAAHVFHIDYRFDPWLWVWGCAGGTAGVAAAGYLGTRFVLHRPPLQTLREL